MTGINVRHFARCILKVIAVTALIYNSAHATEESVIQYKRPNVDYTKYNQFIIAPLDVSDMRIVPPAWADKPESKKWQLTDKDIEFIRSQYMQNISAGIVSSGHFKAVDTLNANTIKVEVRIVRLTPWVKKGDKSTTKGSGELTYEAELRDALSNDLLVLVEGVQTVGKNYQENTRLTREHNLTQHFKDWGESLSKALKKAKEAK